MMKKYYCPIIFLIVVFLSSCTERYPSPHLLSEKGKKYLLLNPETDSDLVFKNSNGDSLCFRNYHEAERKYIYERDGECDMCDRGDMIYREKLIHRFDLMPMPFSAGLIYELYFDDDYETGYDYEVLKITVYWDNIANALSVIADDYNNWHYNKPNVLIAAFSDSITLNNIKFYKLFYSGTKGVNCLYYSADDGFIGFERYGTAWINTKFL